MATGKATQALAALLAAGVVGGWFVTSGSLDPVLADAVAFATAPAPGRKADAGPATAAPKLQKVADWQYFDGRPEWSSVRGVPTVEAPADPVMPTRPAIAPPENPHRRQFTGPAPMPTYSLEPRQECLLQHGPGINAHVFTAVAIGGGRATVTWSDLDDPDVKYYQVAAEPEYVIVGNGSTPVGNRPTTPVYRRVAPPGDCVSMSVTVTGLKVGFQYRFVLQSINTSRLQTRNYTIGRGESETVTIT
jgi:hypothetical protein